jgi:hypothetical protein
VTAFQAVLTNAPADGATLCGFSSGNYHLLEVRGAGMARVTLDVDDDLTGADLIGSSASSGLVDHRQHAFTVSENGTLARLVIQNYALFSGGLHATITAFDATGQAIVVAQRVWTIRSFEATKGYTGPCAMQSAADGTPVDADPRPHLQATKPILTIAPADGATLCARFSPYLLEVRSSRLVHVALDVDRPAGQVGRAGERPFSMVESGVAQLWLDTASLSPGAHRVVISAVAHLFAGVEEPVLAERTWHIADSGPCAPSISPNASTAAAQQ